MIQRNFNKTDPMSELSVNGVKKLDENDTITDKDLPISFMQERHLEPIEGKDCIAHMWRMKERVSSCR